MEAHSTEYKPLLCGEPEAAHARRVAAWSAILGERLGLPRVVTRLLEEAATLHHSGVVEYGPKAGEQFQKLAGISRDDLGSFRLGSEEILCALIDELMLPYEKSRLVDPGLLRLILLFAHEFDHLLESRPLDEEEWDFRLRELEGLDCGRQWQRLSRALAALRPAGVADLARAASRIPVSPSAAARIRALSRSPEVSVLEVERAAAEDPVAAALVLGAANSAALSNAQPIGDLRQAVLHIGTEAARKLLLTVLVRRLFASGALRPVWNHSLEAAAAAEQLARGAAPDWGGDAFLLGLLHDAGRLALLCLPGAAVSAYQNLLGRGVESVSAEMFLFGFDHGEAGAVVLAAWQLPECWVEAVRHHHTPERAAHPASSLLYLVEEAMGVDEDIASLSRLRHCLALTGFDASRLSRAAPPPDAWWRTMRFAA